MIRLLILCGFLAACVWFFFGWLAAKAEIKWERKVSPQPVMKFVVLFFFILGFIGYLLTWWTLEDEMREIHNLPPRQYKSKAYRKTWTERFFGE